VKRWLESRYSGDWLMVMDNAEDGGVFLDKHQGNLGRYVPECLHGAILFTTRSKVTAARLAKDNTRPIELDRWDEIETAQLVRTHLDGVDANLDEVRGLCSRLDPSALVLAASFIYENGITIGEYLQRLGNTQLGSVTLRGGRFQADGRDQQIPRAAAESWMLSFQHIRRQSRFAGDLLSLMSLFDQSAVPGELLAVCQAAARPI
jgi:hypothetical protein